MTVVVTALIVLATIFTCIAVGIAVDTTARHLHARRTPHRPGRALP